MPDLLVLSHLRWDFVFQRPQHLLTRAARNRRVYFFEEPVFEDGIEPHLDITARAGMLYVVVPHLPAGMPEPEVSDRLSRLVSELVRERLRPRYYAWYYTPMALDFSRQLSPAAVVYDCMDELSQFKNAPPRMLEMEDELLSRADVVFTGGISLYEHKRAKHGNIHPFPSSVDVNHFAKARTIDVEPDDQAHLPRPRMGYAGVIDERFDIELVRGVAEARPEWQLVFIGPVVKIDPAALPRAPNIHYLGARSYDDLPAYLSGWDIGLLPFARNDATRFISPTKTPEYLAAGLRVVSTSIRDVVRAYGNTGSVRIADNPRDTIAAIEDSLSDRTNDAARLAQVDELLSRNSWDRTFSAMWQLVEAAADEIDSGSRIMLASPVAGAI